MALEKSDLGLAEVVVRSVSHRPSPGEVPERLNGLVSKTSAGFALAGGSNPSLSATPTGRPRRLKRKGEVSEWLKEHAWKACVSVSGTVGSNPTLSAIPGAICASVLGRVSGPESGSGPCDGSRLNRVRPGTEQP